LTKIYNSKEYIQLIPPLSESEYHTLKESIKQHGLMVPVIINQYGALLDEIYHTVRCGLANSYLVEENSIIDMKSGLPCRIEYDAQTQNYAFHIRTYF
jgi:hypothetical protein